MAKASIGIYYPVQSFIHRLDARIKILLVVSTTITLFLVNSFYAYLLLGFLYLLVFILSELPISWLYKALRPVFTIISIAVFFQILFTPGADILFRWSIFVVSVQGIVDGLRVIVKIIILSGLASVLSFTTTPIELTDALESLLSPLKIFRVQVGELALIMSIALRFVPQILTEAQDLVKAQKARGADFDSKNLVSRAKALLPIFIPLFIITYRNAEDLGLAMESRGYKGSEGRTHYRERKLKLKDILVLLAVLIILGIAVLIG